MLTAHTEHQGARAAWVSMSSAPTHFRLLLSSLTDQMNVSDTPKSGKGCNAQGNGVNVGAFLSGTLNFKNKTLISVTVYFFLTGTLFKIFSIGPLIKNNRAHLKSPRLGHLLLPEPFLEAPLYTALLCVPPVLTLPYLQCLSISGWQRVTADENPGWTGRHVPFTVLKVFCFVLLTKLSNDSSAQYNTYSFFWAMWDRGHHPKIAFPLTAPILIPHRQKQTLAKWHWHLILTWQHSNKIKHFKISVKTFTKVCPNYILSISNHRHLNKDGRKN